MGVTETLMPRQHLSKCDKLLLFIIHIKDTKIMDKMKEFIEGPALTAALKIRVETLTKANRKLTDENMKLKAQLSFLLPSKIESNG